MNKQKKMSLLLAAHMISLSYVHATRYYVSSYKAPNAQQNTVSNPPAPSTVASPTTQPAFTPAVTTPSVTTPQTTTITSIAPVVKAVPAHLGSVANYKTQFKDVTGTGYTKAIAATLIFTNKDTLGADTFSASDILDILKAAAAPLAEKDYTKRLRTVEQKNAAINLFNAFLKNITGDPALRILYKGKALSKQSESRFFKSDEAEITTMLTQAKNAPLTPPDLLDPLARTAYVKETALDALTKYTTYAQNPIYLNSMLKYLKVFFDKRADVPGCSFEAYSNFFTGDHRFKKQDVREKTATLAATLYSTVIQSVTDWATVGFTSRKELKDNAKSVLDILAKRLAVKEGRSNYDVTVNGYVTQLDKIK